LYQDETECFECDAAELVEDAGQIELDLADGGDDNADDDEGDVPEGLE
jgi:hypothetical protein